MNFDFFDIDIIYDDKIVIWRIILFDCIDLNIINLHILLIIGIVSCILYFKRYNS